MIYIHISYLITYLINKQQKFYSLPKGGGGGGGGEHVCFYASEYIKTTRDKIKTNQMDLTKTRNKQKMQIILYFIYKVQNRRM